MHGALIAVGTDLYACALEADGEGALHQAQIPADDLLFQSASKKEVSVGTEHRGHCFQLLPAQRAAKPGLGVGQMYVAADIGKGKPPVARVPIDALHPLAKAGRETQPGRVRIIHGEEIIRGRMILRSESLAAW